MKIRTFKYVFKEGLLNIVRNWLMSFASISAIVVSLLIFGVFYIAAYNVNINTALLKEQPHIIMWVDEALADFEVEKIGEELEENELIAEIEFLSREDAYERMKEMLGDRAEVMEGLGNSIFRPGYMIELKDPDTSEQFVDEVSDIYGVAEVRYSQKWLDFIVNISKWIQWISGIFIIVFLVVSVLIISNTIKLTVYARRKEINIMKYVGASDSFIRWPFVVEGIFLGIIGSAIAYLITGFAYNLLIEKSGEFMIAFGDNLRLANLGEIALGLALFYAALGMLVGAAGSALSMRKYLKV